MYFLFCDRDNLIRHFPRHLAWAEVGVYRGDFSQKIVDFCDPSELLLIDNWRFDIETHNPFADTPEHLSGFSGRIHWQHFGNDPNATQEVNYQYVRSRFAQSEKVKIIRENSIVGIQQMPNQHFDVIYIDANHQYEYVLRDLMEASKKIKPGGILLMNDFYEGPGGAEQNLGIIGAVNTFVKRFDYFYVAMTYGSYSDVAIAQDPNSALVQELLGNLNSSDTHFIGISDALVPNIRYKAYKKANGSIRYLPLL